MRPPPAGARRLDRRVHLREAHNINPDNVHSYREYPAPQGQGWPDRLADEIGTATSIGVEPTLRQGIFVVLASYEPRLLPLVEDLRLVKTATEIRMIRRAAYYADMAVKRLLAASRHVRSTPNRRQPAADATLVYEYTT